MMKPVVKYKAQSHILCWPDTARAARQVCKVRNENSIAESVCAGQTD